MAFPGRHSGRIEFKLGPGDRRAPEFHVLLEYLDDLALVALRMPLIDEVRTALDPWLGDPSWKAGQGRFTLNYLNYRFDPTTAWDETSSAE